MEILPFQYMQTPNGASFQFESKHPTVSMDYSRILGESYAISENGLIGPYIVYPLGVLQTAPQSR